MGMIFKLFAVLILAGGLWVWASGHSVTEEKQVQVSAPKLAASALLAADEGPFDKEGTILLDQTQGQGGTPYLLYTEYTELGKPSVKTKRLVFLNRDECAALNLPCATNQPGVPVRPDDAVRVVGVVKNEQVEVREVYRL
jgi:hypothetical protein